MIYNSISLSSQKYWTPQSKLTIDESMVAYNGDHAGTVYMPANPLEMGSRYLY